MIETRAAVVHEPAAAFTIEDVELETPRDDEVLVRIRAVGICRTDLSTQRGNGVVIFPAVLGHEGAGVVRAVGDNVRTVRVGDRVALSFASCGSCEQCAVHMPARCSHLRTLNQLGMRPDGSRAIRRDGVEISSHYFGQSSFAYDALTYERNVVPIGDAPFELAAPLGCGVQTGVGTVTTAMQCRSQSTIVIIGAGAVGASALLGAVIQRCGRIVVVEPMAERRQTALTLGATDVVDPGDGSALVERLLALLPDGADYVVDTSGRQSSLEAGLAVLGMAGTLAIVGIPGHEVRLAVNPGTLLRRGQTVTGVLEGDSDPRRFIPQMLRWWKEGLLPLEKLVRTFPFERINDAVAAQERGDCIKAVLIMDEMRGDLS